MKTIAEIKNDNYVFNHLVYDNSKDKYFAMHSHNTFELIYVFGGEVEYTIENKKYYIKPDTLILIKPYTYHCFTISTTRDYEKIGIQINTDFLGMDFPLNDSAEVFSVADGIIKDIFRKLSFYYKSFPLNDFLDMFFPLVKEIFYNLSLYENSASDKFEHLPTYLSQAIAYINENLFTIKDLSEISSALYISKSYFISLFNKHLKIAPKQYITEKRLLYAKNMISMGKHPTEVYEKCGFSNYTTFFRSYKRYFGVSPSANKYPLA